MKDEASGDTYYFNPSTGETTWDTPPGFEAPAAAPVTASPPAPSPKAAPAAPTPTAPAPAPVSSEWTAVLDAESNEFYYHNAGTGETTWDRPAGFVDPPKTGATAASPSAGLPPSPTSRPPPRKHLSAESKSIWRRVIEKAKADAAAASGADPAGGVESLRAFAEAMKAKREKRAAETGASSGAAGGAGGEADSPAAAAGHGTGSIAAKGVATQCVIVL